MQRTLVRLGVCAIALVLASCATQPAAMTSSSHNYNRADLDPSTAACDNFYQYAVGGWMKNNPIPPAYSSWGSFNVLAEGNRTKLRTILTEAGTANASAGSPMRQLGDVWATCMDTAAVEQQGIAPLRDELARIEHINSLADLQDQLARQRSMGLPSVIGFSSDTDLKNPTMNLAEVGQGSLGLPEPNYYSDTDERTANIRTEYEKYVAKIFTLLGDAPDAAAAKARNVLRLERDLAAASLTRVQRRDIEAQYNPRPFTDLATVTPSIDWTRYVAAVRAPQFDRINVAHPKYYAELERQLKTTPIAEWRDYLRFRITDAMAPYLSKAFDEAEFEFRGRTLSGRKQQHPRERRCVSWIDNLLGEPLGQVYAERHFTPATKARALEMIENLRSALRSNIGALGWMDPKTKAQGLQKLDAIALKIGYPEKWIDYSSVTTDRTSFAGNVLRSQSFLARRPIEKIGKPVDKSEWQMSTPTVNAYNNPVWNEIVFSAGILQPPFYDPLADDAYNYGGMGAVIGHELIHDFDDQGRLFDATGSMSDWWTSTDAKEFEKRAQCVADQFSSFELGNGLKMDGKLVLGESIADLGGLKIAYAAYQKSIAGKPRQIIDGFTPEQRFFLGWARIWSDNATREAIELQAKTDPHPISEYRVNGPLSNLPEFAAAFGCPATKPMVRADDKRCGVW